MHADAPDLGRQLDGRTHAQIQPTLQQRADASAARNAGGVSRDTRVRAELGTVAPEKYATDPAGYFTPTTSAASCTSCAASWPPRPPWSPPPASSAASAPAAAAG